MNDDTTTSEAEVDSLDTSTNIENSNPVEMNSEDTTNAPDNTDANQETFGGDNDTMKEANKASTLEKLLQLAPKGKVMEVATQGINKYLLWDAKSALRESMEEGSHTNKMLKAWNSLNEEGKVAFVNQDAGLIGLMKELATKTITPLALAELQMKGAKWFAVKIMPQDWIGMSMFNKDEVLEKVSYGVLPCSEQTAKVADAMYSRLGKSTATITKVIAKFEPEIEPLAKVAGVEAMVQGNIEKMLPAIRAEISAEAKLIENKNKAEEMAVTNAQGEERDAIRGLEPPKLLNEEMPVNTTASANNDDAFKNAAA